MNQIITIICITLLAALAMYFETVESKDVVIAAVSGLVGYLSAHIPMTKNVVK